MEMETEQHVIYVIVTVVLVCDIVDMKVLCQISYRLCGEKYSKIYWNIRVVIVNYLFCYGLCVRFM